MQNLVIFLLSHTASNIVLSPTEQEGEEVIIVNFAIHILVGVETNRITFSIN